MGVDQAKGEVRATVRHNFVVNSKSSYQRSPEPTRKRAPEASLYVHWQVLQYRPAG